MQIGTMYIYRDIEPSIEKWEILFSHSELENKKIFLANPALFPPFPLLEKCSFSYDLILHYPKKALFNLQLLMKSILIGAKYIVDYSLV